MPAKKPAGLIRRAETKAERDRRRKGEDAMKPRRGLSGEAPTRLKDHPVASAAWRRLMRLYDGIEAEIVSGLDFDLVIDYCILMEQAGELDQMRRTAFDAHSAMQAIADSEEFRTWDAAMKIALVGKLNRSSENLVKLDGRADRKRALLFQLRQSLYLTPRARAGAAPAEKTPEPPPDELEMLLNEVTNELNSGHGQ